MAGASRTVRTGRRRATDPFKFDRALLTSDPRVRETGDLRLAGADEAGRGCLAGPLVAAAVVLDYSTGGLRVLEGLTDSKQLTPRAREELYRNIVNVATRVVWVAFSAHTIDRVGLHRCNLEALRRALAACDGEYGLGVVDGFDVQGDGLRAIHLIGADYKSATVAAASVAAKVVRDRIMRGLAVRHPEYGFEEHVGYGTDRHRQALLEHGPCTLHRLSFRGVGTVQLGLWDG